MIRCCLVQLFLRMFHNLKWYCCSQHTSPRHQYSHYHTNRSFLARNHSTTDPKFYRRTYHRGVRSDAHHTHCMLLAPNTPSTSYLDKQHIRVMSHRARSQACRSGRCQQPYHKHHSCHHHKSSTCPRIRCPRSPICSPNCTWCTDLNLYIASISRCLQNRRNLSISRHRSVDPSRTCRSCWFLNWSSLNICPLGNRSTLYWTSKFSVQSIILAVRWSTI